MIYEVYFAGNHTKGIIVKAHNPRGAIMKAENYDKVSKLVAEIDLLKSLFKENEFDLLRLLFLVEKDEYTALKFKIDSWAKNEIAPLVDAIIKDKTSELEKL